MPPRFREFLDVAIELAEGRATPRARKAARGSAMDALFLCSEEADPQVRRAFGSTKLAISHALSRKPIDAARYTKNAIVWSAVCMRWRDESLPWPIGRDDPGWARYQELIKEERQNQCAIIRDLAGSPFQPVPIDELNAWQALDPSVRSLATEWIRNGAWHRGDALAMSLERAGCPAGQVLEHLQHAPRHWRGCWAVELVAGIDREE